MALKTMVKRITDAKAKYDEELEAAGKTVKKALAEELGALVPPGYCLHWTQGTPSFNDGDPCVFSVYDPHLIRVDEEEDDDGDDDSDDDDELDEEDDGDDDDDSDDDEDDDEPFEMSLDTAIERYGKPDSEGTWTREDYSKPQFKNAQGDMVWPMKSEKYSITGFPAIKGYTKAKLKELEKAWRSIPEDLMKNAFGDGAEVRIYSNGTLDSNDWYCE